MDDDRPWLGEEPSACADLTFPPLATAIAVFLAVASPICFLGIARAEGTNVVVVAVGILVGTVIAVAAFLALAVRDGRGPNIRGRL
jgi:NO-binding membrane sensor protein with MHYT domain